MNDKNSEETVGFTVSPEQCLTGKIVTVPQKGFFYLDLEKAREYYLKGGVHKEIALQAGYTEEELNPIRNEWESKILGKAIRGYFITSDSDIEKAQRMCALKDENIFKTEKQAKSALAYAQLTQLMGLPEYNGDWVPDWNNSNEKKFCIACSRERLKIDTFYEYRQKLSFKNMELAERFLENNFDLLKQFNEMD